jgi:1-deoxy-D-xylulose-5-phosphate synthase
MTTRVFDTVNSPSDVKKLDARDLETLAEEIREELTTTLLQVGGHLASNLGIVELSIALHRVFDSPNDRIVFDVGHQSYVHKLLTGRKARFGTIRQYGGLSGFCARDESEHDMFGAGHASTSISAAVGMAIARDLRHEDHAVIAVIGDGALTGGMSFEAINHAGDLGTRLIVILNDNEMSISSNVGAIATYLNKIRTDEHYFHAKEDVQSLLSKLPLGHELVQFSRHVKKGVKEFWLPPSTMWEELGFLYMGPVDGHNVHECMQALEVARLVKGPTLLHVLTRKGKGYAAAEKDPVKLHGVSAGPKPDAAPRPEAAKKVMTYPQAFARAMIAEAERDPRVVAITPAMLEGSGLTEFAKHFPERTFDVGIAEQHAVTFGAGLAAAGMRPVVAIYSTFLQRAFDQVIHDVCIQNLPVVFALDRAGLVGEDGRTHHGMFDLSYLRLIPNIVVSAPKDEDELARLLTTGLRHDGPFALRYPRGNGAGVGVAESPQPIEIGKAELLKRGRDGAILAIGSMVLPSVVAAEQLSRAGIDVAVLNARWVKPLDEDAIVELAQTSGFLLCVEEQTTAGGFGSAVLELLAHHPNVTAHTVLHGLGDAFVEHGSQTVLRNLNDLTAEGIERAFLNAFPELAIGTRTAASA